MHFCVVCTDKPGGIEVRLANRPAHLEYLKSFRAGILAAGPTLGDDGATPTGSALIVEFQDRKALDAFLAGDPYAKAGLFQDVKVWPWKNVIPRS